MSRMGLGGAFGAVAGLVCAELLIVLPVALSDDTDAQDVECLANLLFVGLPLVLLGALAGVLVAGRGRPPSPEQSPGRSAIVVVAVGLVALAFFVPAGTTSLLG